MEYSAYTELRLYCHVLNVTFSDFIGLPKNETADSAQPRNRSTVTRPFSSLEGGVWERDYLPGACARGGGRRPGYEASMRNLLWARHHGARRSSVRPGPPPPPPGLRKVPVSITIPRWLDPCWSRTHLA